MPHNQFFLSILFVSVFFSNPLLAIPKDTLGVVFKSEEYALTGNLIVPKDRNNKMPAVIFLVGSGGNSSYKGNYKDFLHFFLEKPFENENVALFYFDKRGVRNSEGKWYQTNFKERAVDAKNAAEYLKKFPYINENKIYVVGHSQGGWIVQLCLANYPTVFAGGISMAGATFGVKKQLINDYYSQLVCNQNYDSLQAMKKATQKVNSILRWTSIFPIQKNWKQLKRIKHFEIENTLDKIQQPILYMWGENDALVNPMWCMQELSTKFPKGLPANFSYYVGKGENHSFKPTILCHKGSTKQISYSEESKKILFEWLMTQFKKF